MTETLRDRRGGNRELVQFGALTTVIYLVCIAMIHAARFDAHAGALSWGAALDLTVTVPAAYWLLVVRRGAARLRSVLAVLALSLLGAKLLLPAGHEAFLPWARFATAPVELGVLIIAIHRVRLARHVTSERNTDVLTQLRSAFTVILGNSIAGYALGHEAATFYYAFGRGRLPARNAGMAADPDTQFAAAAPFTTAVLVAFNTIIIIETAVLHLLVSHHSTIVAWILTATSAYAIVWLVALQRSSGQRFSLIGTRTLKLRIGLRCDATIPWSNVASVLSLTWRDMIPPAPGYVNAAAPSDPNVLLEFRDPVRTEGPYGIPRTATQLSVRLERPDVFVSLVAARISA